MAEETEASWSYLYCIVSSRKNSNVTSDVKVATFQWSRLVIWYNMTYNIMIKGVILNVHLPLIK